MKKLESLSAFQARTGGFIFDSLPHGGALQTNENLSRKVDGSGKMKPFAGNTVVFPLPEAVKRELGQVQERLYQSCAPALAEPLEASSFHITLHDLLSGEPDQALRDRIDGMRCAVLTCLEKISEDGGPIRLQSTALFNMVNTSMVLGFAPADEASCTRLMTCYELLQEIVPLSYPLTPHVTIAYFRPGTICAGLVEALREAVDETAGREAIRMELSTQVVEYHLFSDMNHYWRERSKTGRT